MTLTISRGERSVTVRGATAGDNLYAPYFYAAIVEAEFPGVPIEDVPARAFTAPIAFAQMMLQTVEAVNVPVVNRYATSAEIVACYRTLFEGPEWREFVQEWLAAAQAVNAGPPAPSQKKT